MRTVVGRRGSGFMDGGGVKHKVVSRLRRKKRSRLATVMICGWIQEGKFSHSEMVVSGVFWDFAAAIAWVKR